MKEIICSTFRCLGITLACLGPVCIAAGCYYTSIHHDSPAVVLGFLSAIACCAVGGALVSITE